LSDRALSQLAVPAASTSPARDPRYQGYRFPPELSSHAVWRYSRFQLRHRASEDRLAERGLVVSDEAIRRCWHPFGPTCAAGWRRRRTRAGDTWHLDQVQPKLSGKRPWRWRAVDQDAVVLDLVVQDRRE
jgi:putative transposase